MGNSSAPVFKKAFVKRELVFFFFFFKVQFLLFLLKVFCSGGKVHIKQINARMFFLSFIFSLSLIVHMRKAAAEGTFYVNKVLFCFLHCWCSVIK